MFHIKMIIKCILCGTLGVRVYPRRVWLLAPFLPFWASWEPGLVEPVCSDTSFGPCFIRCLVVRIASSRMGVETQAWRLVTCWCSPYAAIGCLVMCTLVVTLTSCSHGEVTSHHHTWNNFVKWIRVLARVFTHCLVAHIASPRMGAKMQA